jgi:hypothetical protein
VVDLACAPQSKQSVEGYVARDELSKRRKISPFSSWWDKLSVAPVAADQGPDDEGAASSMQWARVQIVTEVVSRFGVHIPAPVLESVWNELIKLAESAHASEQQTQFILVLNAISAVTRAISLRQYAEGKGSAETVSMSGKKVGGAIRNNVLHSLLLAKLPTSPSPVQDAIYGVLGSLVSSGLVVLENWWDLVIQQQKCRGTLLGLALNCLQHIAISDPEARLDLLRFVLEGYDPLLEHPNMTVSAILGIMEMPDWKSSCTMPSSTVVADSPTSKELAEISAVRVLPPPGQGSLHVLAKNSSSAAAPVIVPMQIRVKLEEMLVNLLQRKAELVQTAGSIISGKRRRTLGVDAAQMSEKLLVACRLLKLFIPLERSLGEAEAVSKVLQTVFSNQLEFVAKYWEELASRPKKQAEILSELHDVVSSRLCECQPEAQLAVVEACGSFLEKHLFRASAPAAALMVASAASSSGVDEFGFGPSSSTNDDVLDCTLCVIRLLGSVRCFHHGIAAAAVDPLLKRAFLACQSDLMRITLVSSVVVVLPHLQPPPPDFLVEALTEISSSLANFMASSKLRNNLLEVILRASSLLEDSICRSLAEPVGELLELVVSQWWKLK